MSVWSASPYHQFNLKRWRGFLCGYLRSSPLKFVVITKIECVDICTFTVGSHMDTSQTCQSLERMHHCVLNSSLQFVGNDDGLSSESVISVDKTIHCKLLVIEKEKTFCGLIIWQVNCNIKPVQYFRIPTLHPLNFIATCKWVCIWLSHSVCCLWQCVVNTSGSAGALG